MPSIGIFLIFGAVILRSVVVSTGEPYFYFVLGLLGLYGLLLLAERRILHPKAGNLVLVAGVYFLLQSAITISLLEVSKLEDFFALLFIPLSLSAVSLFGRRSGYLWIAAFSLILSSALFFATEGPAFGLAMGGLYSGMCFLFGGYANKVHEANDARDQNQRTYKELQAAHLELQGYVDHKATLAMEHERNRLARDLHDSVTQTAFSMNLAAQSACLLWEKEPSRTTEQLLRLEELSANALREIQSLVMQLKPRSVSEHNLPQALHRLIDERKSRDGLQVSLKIHGEKILSETEIHGLYSIAQEALNNIVKHSGARQADIHLSLDDRNSFLEILDHGLGFDPDSALNQRGHLGLAAMSERSREIGWNFSIESHPGEGTRISVTRDQPGSLSFPVNGVQSKMTTPEEKR